MNQRPKPTHRLSIFSYRLPILNPESKQFSPRSPIQRILSRLFDVIGAEGLLRPAMHYRWNFPEQNLEFLKFHFQSVTPRVPDRGEKAEASIKRMRAACMAFGAIPETFDLVETLYLKLLQKLDSHFSNQPYLLGGKPCIGDFGMIAPLYGHLSRDPKPLSLMQAHALRLFRWVERMNRPEPDVGEFEDQGGSYLSDDEINALAQPFRLYLLKRVQDEFYSLSGDDQRSATKILAACDMSEILDLKLTRDIGRQNNLEVWL